MQGEASTMSMEVNSKTEDDRTLSEMQINSNQSAMRACTALHQQVGAGRMQSTPCRRQQVKASSPVNARHYKSTPWQLPCMETASRATASRETRIMHTIYSSCNQPRFTEGAQSICLMACSFSLTPIQEPNPLLIPFVYVELRALN